MFYHFCTYDLALLDEIGNENLREESGLLWIKGRIWRWRQDWLEHVEKMVEGTLPKHSWGTMQKVEFIEAGTGHWHNLWREEGEEEKGGGDPSQYRISLTIKWKIVYRRVYLSCFEFYRTITLWVVIYLYKYRPVTTQHFSPLYWVFNGVPKSNLNTAWTFLTSRVSVIFRKKGEKRWYSQ
jgi:hypothetical protein